MKKRTGRASSAVVLVGIQGASGLLVAAGAPALMGACAGAPFTLSFSAIDAGNILDASAGAPDGASPGDGGGSDSTIDAEGGGVPFCGVDDGGGHLFCEDFTSGVPGQFMEVTGGTATLAVGPHISADTTFFVSPPQSALIQVPALKVGDDVEAFLTASVSAPAPGPRLRLEASVSLGAACESADGTTFAVLALDSYALAVEALSTQSALIELVVGADGGVTPGAEHPFSTLPEDPKWFNLILTLDLAAKTATLALGNNAALDGIALTQVPATLASAATARIDLGAEIHAVTAPTLLGGCHAHVDNVAFDVLP